MSSTRSPLKGLGGCGCGGGAPPAVSGFGQSADANDTGFQLSVLGTIAVSFAAGAVTMHLMRLFNIVKNPRRSRRR